MTTLAIDINQIPELASPMAAYGSINQPDHMSGSMFDMIVAVVMILFDDDDPAKK
jgi:hypothetical protein